MTGEQGYLLVRAGTRWVGVPVEQIVEVVEPGQAYPMPSTEPAVRGVVRVREAILPAVHLGALLDGAGCPAVPGTTGVILAAGGRHICLEVEEADFVLQAAGLPVPPEAALPWAVAVARHAEALVPLLDLRALVTALAPRIPEARPA